MTTGLDAYIETRIFQLFCECLMDLEPERAAALLEQFVEWAGEDEERVDIFKKIFAIFCQGPFFEAVPDIQED